MSCHQEATAIHAVPAEAMASGFRLLVLRELRSDGAPPAFAVIEQQILRRPERLNRHGVSFAVTFGPEVMDWLIEHLGRPAHRDAAGAPCRNPRWPTLTWRPQERTWPDGLSTVEWFAEVVFDDEAVWSAFQERWRRHLQGERDG